MLKNFPLYNSVYGRYESSQTENGKNHLGMNLGLYHHVLNSCAQTVICLQIMCAKYYELRYD